MSDIDKFKFSPKIFLEYQFKTIIVLQKTVTRGKNVNNNYLFSVKMNYSDKK